MVHPLKRYRERHELTQEQLGQRIGMSLYAVHRIEASKIELTLKQAMAIKRGTRGEVTPEKLAEAS